MFLQNLSPNVISKLTFTLWRQRTTSQNVIKSKVQQSDKNNIFDIRTSTIPQENIQKLQKKLWERKHAPTAVDQSESERESLSCFSFGPIRPLTMLFLVFPTQITQRSSAWKRNQRSFHLTYFQAIKSLACIRRFCMNLLQQRKYMLLLIAQQVRRLCRNFTQKLWQTQIS